MGGGEGDRRHGRVSVFVRPALLLLALFPGVARAETVPAPNVIWGRDVTITAAAFLGAHLAQLIPVDSKPLWQRQLLPIDDRLEGRLSDQASGRSDLLQVVGVLMPFGLLAGQGGGFGEANDKRLLLYAETLGLSSLASHLTQHLVARPCPYAYSDDPRVQAYAADEGTSSRLSFYSGHASTTFAAAVAGSYLYAQASTDPKSRAVVWAFGLGIAGATADLRTRAGKHFYSDVIVGALAGAGIGLLVPYLRGGPAYHPSAGEWAAIAAAPVAGMVIASFLPAAPTFSTSSTSLGATPLPWLAPGGGGIMLVRSF